MKVCKEDPSIFIAPLTWKQSKVELDRLLKQCEYCFNNWKISGNHGAFNDNKENKEDAEAPKPFADFAGSNQSLRCLHEFVYQFPDIFEKTIGHLPEGAFRESIGDKGASSSSTPHTLRKKTRLQQMKEDNLSMLQKHLSIGKREQAQANQNAAHLDYRLMMHRDALDKAEDRKMELFREARKRKKLSHGQINARCQKHIDKTKKACAIACETGVLPEPKMGDEQDKSDDDSLCSVFCQICRQDENIAESERRLVQARKDAKASSK